MVEDDDEVVSLGWAGWCRGAAAVLLLLLLLLLPLGGMP